MKVGVIAAEMEGQTTGVGRYLEGLLSGLEQWDHGVEWHLFFQGDSSQSLRLPEDDFHAHFSNHHGSRVLWEQILVSRDLKTVAPDVVFGPAYTLPFGLPAPAVVTIHDLSFEALPDDFGPRERWRRRLLARRAARVSRRVITDTGHLASLVEVGYRLASDRISIVPLGIDSVRFSPRTGADDRRVLRELDLNGPFILMPGTVFDRRLPRQVLGAFAKVRRDRPELRLVIAGANRLRQQEQLLAWVAEMDLESSVRHLGWVKETSLAPLYRAAELGVYVSRHEGYGLPPMECLACGTPVVVSSGLGLDDAWPDYPYRVSELSAESIATVMAEILGDETRTAQVVAQAGPIISGLGWEQSSRRLVTALSKALSP